MPGSEVPGGLSSAGVGAAARGGPASPGREAGASRADRSLPGFLPRLCVCLRSSPVGEELPGPPAVGLQQAALRPARGGVQLAEELQNGQRAFPESGEEPPEARRGRCACRRDPGALSSGGPGERVLWWDRQARLSPPRSAWRHKLASRPWDRTRHPRESESFSPQAKSRPHRFPDLSQATAADPLKPISSHSVFS